MSATGLLWVILAPLGRPIVPEEYTEMAVSTAPSIFGRVTPGAPPPNIDSTCCSCASGELGPTTKMRATGKSTRLAAAIAVSQSEVCTMIKMYNKK